MMINGMLILVRTISIQEKKTEVESSKMTGNPKDDIPYLYKMLKLGKLYKTEYFL